MWLIGAAAGACKCLRCVRLGIFPSLVLFISNRYEQLAQYLYPDQNTSFKLLSAVNVVMLLCHLFDYSYSLIQ